MESSASLILLFGGSVHLILLWGGGGGAGPPYPPRLHRQCLFLNMGSVIGKILILVQHLKTSHLLRVLVGLVPYIPSI